MRVCSARGPLHTFSTLCLHSDMCVCESDRSRTVIWRFFTVAAAAAAGGGFRRCCWCSRPRSPTPMACARLHNTHALPTRRDLHRILGVTSGEQVCALLGPGLPSIEYAPAVMRACVYVCVCVRMSTCVHACTYLCTLLGAGLHKHTHARTCFYVSCAHQEGRGSTRV